MRPAVAPPAARHEVEILRDQAIPLGQDGAELAADVYLPRGAGPVPALLTLVPYHKDGLAGVGGWLPNHYFAERGYASVLIDFRGTGGSGGTARAPFDPAEADDGAAAVAWAADQPWCDGAVGMWGVSYGAITAMRTAARRPPALKAIAPVVGHIDHERDFVHPAGARGGVSSLAIWGLVNLALQLTPPLQQDRAGRWLARWRRRLVEAEPYVIDLVRRGPGDPSWRTRVVDAAAIDVPTFCVGGWRDLFCDGTLRAFEQIDAPKKLLMGPWLHTLPDESPFEPVDFLSLAVRWWDRWLRGERNGIEEEPPVTVYVQGRGTWRHLDSWPPDATIRTLHADPGGGLAPQPADAGERITDVDPTVGAAGGLWGMPTRGFGLPADQHDDDVRSIAFTSAPLPEALQITGRPRVTLQLPRAGDAQGPIVVKLAAVDPDGRSTLITSGVHAGGAVAPAQASVTVELWGTSFEVAAGARIRLTVAGGDFPRLWPHPDERRLAVGAPGTTIDLPVARTAEPASPPTRPPASRHPLVRRSDPVYAVTRDRIDDAVSIEIGERLAASTPDGASAFEIEQTVVARVARERPEAARMSGVSTTVAHTPHGEIVVRAELLLHGDQALAAGTVTWDGRLICDRRWTA